MELKIDLTIRTGKLYLDIVHVLFDEALLEEWARDYIKKHYDDTALESVDITSITL